MVQYVWSVPPSSCHSVRLAKWLKAARKGRVAYGTVCDRKGKTFLAATQQRRSVVSCRKTHP